MWFFINKSQQNFGNGAVVARIWNKIKQAVHLFEIICLCLYFVFCFAAAGSGGCSKSTFIYEMPIAHAALDNWASQNVDF